MREFSLRPTMVNGTTSLLALVDTQHAPSAVCWDMGMSNPYRIRKFQQDMKRKVLKSGLTNIVRDVNECSRTLVSLT